MTVEFTQEQMDHICYQVGEWYLLWKDRLINWEAKTHNLGFAKEQLKQIILDVNCAESVENMNKRIDKNEDVQNPQYSARNNEEILLFLEKVSLVLGMTYGSIMGILTSPDNELRIKLSTLGNKLSQDVGKLYS